MCWRLFEVVSGRYDPVGQSPGFAAAAEVGRSMLAEGSTAVILTEDEHPYRYHLTRVEGALSVRTCKCGCGASLEGMHFKRDYISTQHRTQAHNARLRRRTSG